MFHQISLPNQRTPLIPPIKERWHHPDRTVEATSYARGRLGSHGEHFVASPQVLSLNKRKKPVKLLQPHPDLNINWENALPKSKPSQFGPHYWYMLHTMALNYPNDPTDFIKRKMKCFVEALPYLLPCKDCSEHAKEFLSNHTNDLHFALSSKESLFKFLWFFHNHVNERLGKPQISLEQAFNMYKA